MPIIPIKTKIQMTNINEITQAEFDAFVYHKTKIEYNQAEAMDLLNLVRKYINPRQASCFSCGNALRDAKTVANEFYMANKEKIQSILDARNTPAPVQNNTQNKTKK